SDVGMADNTSCALTNLPESDCIFINWNLGSDTPHRHKATVSLLYSFKGGRTCRADEPVLRYLLAFQNLNARFLEFSHDTYGVECINGECRIFCIKEKT